jgi:hypothetical protein
MDVVIDGQPGLDTGEATTVLEVVGLADEALQQRGRAMVGVTINGEPVSPEALTEQFDGVPAADAAIEIISRPVSEMVIETLDEMAESLSELPVACQRLAAVFQGEHPHEGFAAFEELATIWNAVKTRQAMAASALDVDFEGLDIRGRAVSEHLRELNSFLDEAAQALRDGDIVLLGDLLEYELSPRAELEGEIVSLLRRQAEAAAR